MPQSCPVRRSRKGEPVWWHMRKSLGWDVAAAFFVTCSVTMLTDFTHRLLGANPDSLGIISISTQALFVVAATSTFTKAGSQWMQGFFSHLKIEGNSQPRWRFLLGTALFAVVCPIWIWLPSKLAQHYNTRAFNLQYLSTVPDPSREAQDYQRAVALDPNLSAAHFNLGELYESFYQYDNARDEYQKAIIANHGDINSYNNLSRAFLLEGNGMEGLRVADTGLGLVNSSTAPVTLAALRKNEAWAEYILGFYEPGLRDANLSVQSQPNAAAAYCLLGKIYGKLGKTADAKASWKKFTNLMASPKGQQPMIEPDCIRLAEVENETK